MPSTRKTSDDPFGLLVHPETGEPIDWSKIKEQRASLQFLVTAMCDWPYEDFAMMSATFEDRLNEAIDLSEYTKEVKQINIIPLIFSPAYHNHLHQEYIHYSKKEKLVSLHPFVDQERLAQVTMETYPAFLGEVLYEKGKKLPVLPEPLLARIREVLAGIKKEELEAVTAARDLAMREYENRTFHFSAWVGDPYLDFALLNTRFTQAMREQIDLAAYSKEIRHLDVVPILFPDRAHFHEESIQYNPQTRTVTLQPLIDPSRLAEATLPTYPALLGEVLYEKGRQLSVLPEALLARMREVLAEIGNSIRDEGNTDDTDSTDLH